MRSQRDIYGGQDPRERPIYSVPEAARLVAIPVSTLSTWISAPAGAGSHRGEPLITIRRGSPRLLTFSNLAEVFVLASIRRVHGISFQKVRKALRYVSVTMSLPRPLIDASFQSDGARLFVEHFGRIVDAEDGQVAISVALRDRLHRIDFDQAGLAQRLFPLPRAISSPEQPRSIVIDPRRAFGRAVLFGTGIPTSVIAERHRAGESLTELADDYQRAQVDIEDALRFESRAAA